MTPHVGLHGVLVTTVSEEDGVADPVVQLYPRHALLDQLAVLGDAAGSDVGERPRRAGAVVPHGSRPGVSFSNVVILHCVSAFDNDYLILRRRHKNEFPDSIERRPRSGR